MNNIVCLIAAAQLVLGAAASLEGATVNLPVYGFSMDALEAPPGDATVAALITLLPASEGFAPNINVSIQPYAGAVKDYAALSRDQFKQESYRIVSEKESANEWDVEYSGTSEGKELHFYARALSSGSRVYLVTATATVSQWKTLGTTLSSHVDSFKATK